MNELILLTGASGFVGRQVLCSLAERGKRVRVVVREGKQHLFAHGEAIESVLTTCDLFAENAAWWREVCKGVDTVIHAAWYVEPSDYLQSPKNLDCLVGTLQLSAGAAKAGVRRFVGIGTCFEYDFSSGMMAIDTPLQPQTPYAAAKAAAFMALSQCLPQMGIDFLWCRLFYLYGDGEHPRRLVPYLRSRLAAGKSAELTSGNQIRDFLDVHEAGRMIVNSALSENRGAINICSGKAITIRQLAENIADEYGRRDLLNFGARADNIVDPPCIVGVN